MRRATITLPVRVVIAGGDSLQMDEALVLARKVVESATFASAGIVGVAAAPRSPGITLENVECGTLMDADLSASEASTTRRARPSAVKVYVVIHNFVSHDMFVSAEAKRGDPEIFGAFSTRAKAREHIRPNMDDYIVALNVDRRAK